MKDKVNGHFFESKDHREHGCCWDTAICYEGSDVSDTTGTTTVRFIECNCKDVGFILAALNTKLDLDRAYALLQTNLSSKRRL